VNGIVLNEKGEKMSKRKKNYTDPNKILDLFGADAMRLYLMKSGLVKGESLNFKDEGVKDVIRDILLPFYNAYRFLI
jgi:isoleucyl-tRNA synthetase